MSVFCHAGRGTGVRLCGPAVSKQLEACGYTGCYSLEFGAPSQDSTLLEDAIETLSGWIKD